VKVVGGQVVKGPGVGYLHSICTKTSGGQKGGEGKVRDTNWSGAAGGAPCHGTGGAKRKESAASGDAQKKKWVQCKHETGGTKRKIHEKRSQNHGEKGIRRECAIIHESSVTDKRKPAKKGRNGPIGETERLKRGTSRRNEKKNCPVSGQRHFGKWGGGTCSGWISRKGQEQEASPKNKGEEG